MDAVNSLLWMVASDGGPDARWPAWFAWQVQQAEPHHRVVRLLAHSPECLREAFRGACETAASSKHPVNMKAMFTAGRIIRLFALPDELEEANRDYVVVGAAAMLYKLRDAKPVFKAALHSAKHVAGHHRQAFAQRWIGETAAALAWSHSLQPSGVTAGPGKWKCTGMSPEQLLHAAGIAQTPPNPAQYVVMCPAVVADPSRCWNIVRTSCLHRYMSFDRFLRQATAIVAGEPSYHANAFMKIWIVALASPEAVAARNRAKGKAAVALGALFALLLKRCDTWLYMARLVHSVIIRSTPKDCYRLAIREATTQLPETGTMSPAVLNVPWIYRTCCILALDAAANQARRTPWHLLAVAFTLPARIPAVVNRIRVDEAAAMAAAYRTVQCLLRHRHPVPCAVLAMKRISDPDAKLAALARIAGPEKTRAVRKALLRLPPELTDLVLHQWLVLELLERPF